MLENRIYRIKSIEENLYNKIHGIKSVKEDLFIDIAS